MKTFRTDSVRALAVSTGIYTFLFIMFLIFFVRKSSGIKNNKSGSENLNSCYKDTKKRVNYNGNSFDEINDQCSNKGEF